MPEKLRPVDVEALIREIQRYLALVEAFRAGRRQPPPADDEEG